MASALVSLLAFGSPAGAVPHGDGGLTCGVTAASTDGTTWHGVITGGPWVVPNAAPVQMTCLLQRWDGEGWTTIAAASSPLLPGVTTVPPTPTSFYVPIDPFELIGIGQAHALSEVPVNLQMCTQITVYREPGVPDVYYDDADGDPNNGAQCAKEERAENDLVMVTVIPPRSTGTPCVFLDNDEMPYEVCS